MGFDGQRGMVPIPGQNAVANGYVAGQRNDDAVRHRVDEGRALLDGSDLLTMQFGKGGPRQRRAANPAMPRARRQGAPTRAQSQDRSEIRSA